jgi:hypothetical protein
MSREQVTVSKELHEVLAARWEGFQRLARTLPDRHILAVELSRTPDDQTVAVFTTVRNGAPVRTVVRGDSRGRVNVNSQDYCEPQDKASSAALAARAVTDPSEDPSSLILSEPPPKQGGTPGIIAIGEGLLGAAFNVGELVDTAKL